MTTIPTTRPEVSSRSLATMVPLDLYRDIHKGIRAELFAVTGTAGSLDPADVGGRAAVADHVRSTIAVLVSHAEHEDTVLQPTLVEVLPALAERVEVDHAALEARMVDLQARADEAVMAPEADLRRATHDLYLELASFTSDYLAHQDEEERVIMPALFEAVDFEVVLGMHQAIIASIPPDEMAQSLAFMIPAMNVDDRTELLGGMQAGAPPEAFAPVWSLVRSVLPPGDGDELATRLGLS